MWMLYNAFDIEEIKWLCVGKKLVKTCITP